MLSGHIWTCAACERMKATCLLAKTGWLCQPHLITHVWNCVEGRRKVYSLGADILFIPSTPRQKISKCNVTVGGNTFRIVEQNEDICKNRHEINRVVGDRWVASPARVGPQRSTRTLCCWRRIALPLGACQVGRCADRRNCCRPYTCIDHFALYTADAVSCIGSAGPCRRAACVRSRLRRSCASRVAHESLSSHNICETCPSETLLHAAKLYICACMPDS